MDIKNTVLGDLARDVYTVFTGKVADDLYTNESDINSLVVAGNIELESLQMEADWVYRRIHSHMMGVITPETTTIPLGENVYKMSDEPNDTLRIVGSSGKIISQWNITTPDDLAYGDVNQLNANQDVFRADGNRVAVIRDEIFFSRNFTQAELGGRVVAPVYLTFTKLSVDTPNNPIEVKPKALLAYGIAKRLAPPDFVRNTQYSSLVSEYNDLLTKAIEQNENSNTPGAMFIADSAIRGHK